MGSLLEGLKVIDAASFLAGPCAATIMADFGADVIKVEPPTGDGYRLLKGGYHHDYNWHLTSRNKRGIVIDVSRDDGQAAMHRLVAEADVIVLNYRDDQLRRFDLEYDTLRAINPRLVFAQITGFGTRGPDKDKRGYDSTSWWARSGIMDLLKPFRGAPTFPVGGVGDHTSGMTLFAAIMMALYERERTGLGRCVSTSLIANGAFAAGMHLQGAIAGYDIGAILDEKGYRSPFASVYRTRDDRHLVLALVNPVKEWPILARCLGRPEWLAQFSDGMVAMRNKDTVRDLVAAEIGSRKAVDVCRALDQENMTYSLVERISDVVRDAHLVENEVIIETASTDPDFRWTVANPISIAGIDKVAPNDPPEIGQHTREVLAEAGMSVTEIDALLASGAIAVRE